VSGFLSLVRARLARRQAAPLGERLWTDAAEVASVASARILLRSCNAIGFWVRVTGGRPRIDNRGRIEIGARTRLYCDFSPIELTAEPDGVLEIGERVAINFRIALRSATMSPSVLTASFRTVTCHHG
jgi:hypothetical protein